ncbi:MAG: AbrB/MazE/SpoVT family DNA-binding domain-containing protein [Nanoarchaeota archaeon]
MAIEVKTKKWGNSIGIVIPVQVAEQLNIKPEEEIVIEIEKKNNILKEMFGKAKFKKSAKKMIEDFRKEYESKWMK